MARPVTHGIRQRAAQLGVVKVNGAVRRIDRRTRSRIAGMQQRMDANPLEEMRDALIDAISRGRELRDRADLILLTTPDLANETGLSKFGAWLNNRVRHDMELLLLVEQQLGSRDHTPSLAQYIASRPAPTATGATAGPAEPSDTLVSAAGPIPQADASDAAQPATCSQEPTA